MLQDGYTLETLDIYGVVDGQEKVIIADVSQFFSLIHLSLS